MKIVISVYKSQPVVKMKPVVKMELPQ